jgi:hypothetical protein
MGAAGLQRVRPVAAGAMLTAIAAFAWLGTCTRLSDDDYLWAHYHPWANAMTLVQIIYLTWGGRFSSTFLLALLLPVRQLRSSRPGGWSPD